jgi:D-serine deaminase-like pyridoxal phosphate-dependent protein
MNNQLAQTSRLLRRLDITSPTLLVDEVRARRNIEDMANRVQQAGARFRPHFKTHQSGAVGTWFAETGISSITVSSLAMAQYFAEFGWRDMTLAFLANPLELPRLGVLARYQMERGHLLGLTLDSPEVARAVADAVIPVQAWIKVDTGYGRTGVAWNDGYRLAQVREALGPVPLAGLLTHSGHSYQVRNSDGLETIWQTSLQNMQHARAQLGQDDLLLSLGDTPCCSTAADLSGADELRPGNFVFYDLMQLAIGSCRQEQLACAVACPVVGLYPDRGRLVIHGGAVHLGKERLEECTEQQSFGRLGTLVPNEDEESGPPLALGAVLEDLPVVDLSQEHGVVAVPPERSDEVFGNLSIGDLVLVWPVHSCLTCEMYDAYITLGEDILPRR